MAKRKADETVQVGLRIKESLRLRIEREAQAHGVSQNAEIAMRLERSFEGGDEVSRLIGTGPRAAFIKLVAGAVELIEAQTGGAVLEDPETTGRVLNAIHKLSVLEPWVPAIRKHAPTFPPGIDGVLTLLRDIRPDQPPEKTLGDPVTKRKSDVGIRELLSVFGSEDEK